MTRSCDCMYACCMGGPRCEQIIRSCELDLSEQQQKSLRHTVFVENASVILGHMNAEVMLSIVLEISRNTKYFFRISVELLIMCK